MTANFSETAEYFQKSIKDHRICETYHYHKDMLTDEDDCKLSVNPFYLNEHKPHDKKLIMDKIYRSCRNNPYFLG